MIIFFCLTFIHIFVCVTYTADELELKARRLWSKGVLITKKDKAREFQGQDHYFYDNLQNVNFFLRGMDFYGIVDGGADELLFFALEEVGKLYDRIDTRIENGNDVILETLEITGLSNGDEKGEIYTLCELFKIRFIVGKTVEVITYVGYVPIRASHDGHLTIYLPDCHISGTNKWTLVPWTEETVENFQKNAVKHFQKNPVTGGQNPCLDRNKRLDDEIDDPVDEMYASGSDDAENEACHVVDGGSHTFLVHEYDLSILSISETKTMTIETVVFAEQLKLEVRKLFEKEKFCEIVIFDVIKPKPTDPFTYLRMWEDDNILALLDKSSTFSFFSYDCEEEDDS